MVLAAALDQFWHGVGQGIGDKPLRVSISFGYVISAIGIAIMAPVSNLGTVLFGGFIRSVGGGITWVFFNAIVTPTRAKRNSRTYLRH